MDANPYRMPDSTQGQKSVARGTWNSAVATAKLKLAVALAVVGGLYALVLGGIGAVLTGAGHGTGLFLDATFAPLSLLEPKENSPLVVLTFLFWPIVAPFALYPRRRAVFIGCVGLHYLGILWCVYQHGFGPAIVFRNRFDLVFLWALVYLAGQIGLWIVAFWPWVAAVRPTDPAPTAPTR